MKKICFLLFSLSFLLTSLVSLVGCNSVYNEISKNVSETRYNIFSGSNSSVTATFMCGKREKDYVVNGYSSPLIDFGVVTVTVKSTSLNTDNIRAVITINTHRYEKVLEKNPFDGTFVCDIKTTTDASELSLKLFFGDQIEQLSLSNLSLGWKVDNSKALKIATKAIKPQLKKQIQSGFNGEVYVKIIEDTKVNKGNYYWYVSFVCRNGEKHTVLIDPTTAKILAKS